jgi:hypothetical protein
MRQGCNKNYNFSGKGGDYGKAPLITPPRLCCDDNRDKIYNIKSKRARKENYPVLFFDSRRFYDVYNNMDAATSRNPGSCEVHRKKNEGNTSTRKNQQITNSSNHTWGKRNRRCEEGNPNVLRPTLKQHGTPVCARFA